ncbi:MAG: metallophosphoesterase [Lachnospiraceae bacterium]|nr:metallophosphoesterase [Lachnospiraceae bacterium]
MRSAKNLLVNMDLLKDISVYFNINYKWIYTYDYAPDAVWEPWRANVYGDKGEGTPAWIDEEAAAVAERVCKGILTYILLADSHFTYNGTWDDTVASMRALTEKLPIDGLIHLGDLTDGLLPIAKTNEIERQCIEDMQRLGAPVYIVPGNHDYNYFRGNPEIRYPSTPQYYIDEPGQKLRLIFLDSFDPKEELRYGFTEYCIHWTESVLHMMPKDYVAIIFSHVPPIKQLHAWSDWIRNSHILMLVLDKYADRILAYINGHSHCDHLFNGLHNGQFPIISINCAKCEYFLEHKPEGAVVPYRRLGDRTQESFDIMQVDTEKREIYFTRFGAGQDRIVRNHKAEWV